MVTPQLEQTGILAILEQFGAGRFFEHYWQKHVLAFDIGQARLEQISTVIGPLDIADLAAASRGGTQAWLANDDIDHSVIMVGRDNAKRFSEIGATLYFVDVPMESLTVPLARFAGIPAKKVIASLFYSPRGTGASRHFDANENFTVQLSGIKRWRVGDNAAVTAPLEGFVPDGGQLPSPPDPMQTVEMHPGSFLYVPRGHFHHTETLEASWSLNISYNRTCWADAICDGLWRKLVQSEQWRASVTGLGDCAPDARQENIFPALAEQLRQMLADPDMLEQISRDFLDRPGP